MNIFFVSHRTFECAQLLHDKHVVKMTLETTQLLCSWHYRKHADNLDKPEYLGQLYKPTHLNHPCSLWLAESPANYWFALDLLRELLAEYSHRYHKSHKCENLLGLLYGFAPPRPTFRTGEDLTTPALCMPEQYRKECPVESYRAYYASEKIKPDSKWTNRESSKEFWMKYIADHS